MATIVRRRFRQLPFFAFGHSLGSFIVRAFMATHQDVFDGVILSGTAKPMSFSFFKRRRLEKLCQKAGREYSPKVEDLMMGSLIKPFLNEKGSWLTTLPETLLKKEENPYVGHKMKADAYRDIYRLLDFISSDEWVEAMPRATPILMMAGERDPLGGKDLMALDDLLDDCEFSKVSLKLYAGEKHELLGSLSHESVVADILAFLNEETEAVTTMRRQMREVF